MLCIRAHKWRWVHTFKPVQSCPKSRDYSRERITLLQESDIRAVASLHSTAFVVPLFHACSVQLTMNFIQQIVNVEVIQNLGRSDLAKRRVERNCSGRNFRKCLPVFIQ